MKVFALLLLIFSLSFGESLYVAVASSMRPLMEELKEEFERKNPGVEIKVSYASSGSIYRQILGGAPYEVFLSANEVYPEKLYERGFATKPVPFAEGRLVIFSLRHGVEDKRILLIAKRVAIASPRHAPYGIAGVEFLKNAGLYDRVRGKLVYGSNVAQAFQFVVSGGADVGIVSLSLVKTYRRGNYSVVAKDKHSPIIHSAVITSKGKNSPVAREFVDFLLSEEVKKLLLHHGFEAIK